jgi:phage-related protein
LAHPTIELSYGTNLSVDLEAKTKRTKLGDGQSQRFNRGINAAPQMWSLAYEDVTEAEAETLRQFYMTNSAITPVSWTPTGQSTALKFIGLNFRCSIDSYGVRNFSVTIEQVFDE